MLLVTKFLKKIGLEYAVPTFEAAGIVTPESLGELDPMHFDALGVCEPEDRKKLFFLVQRIKQGQQQAAAVQVQQQQQQQGKARTTSSSRSSTAASAGQHNQKSTETKENTSLSASSSLLTSSASIKNRSTETTSTSSIRNSHPTRTTTRLSSDAVVGPNSRHRRLSGVPMPKKRTSSGGGGSNSTRTSSSSGGSNAITTMSTVTSPSQTRGPQSGISLRTGKPLSTIPSHASAPMSPLVDLPSSSSYPLLQSRSDSRDVEEESDAVVQNPRRRYSDQQQLQHPYVTRRSHSNEEASSDSRARAASGNHDPNSRNRRTSATSRQSLVGTRNSTNGRLRITRGLSLPGDNESTATDDAAPTATISSSTKSCIVPKSHHVPTASISFAAQIDRLRVENAQQHLATSPREASLLKLQQQRVSVVVRKRPVQHDVDILQCLMPHRLLVYQPRTRVDLRREVVAVPFVFDAVIDESSSNVNLYETVVKPLVPNLLGGQCATVFCFGQTGSGKTHTLFGNSRRHRSTDGHGVLSNNTVISDHSSQTAAESGLYVLAAHDLFSTLRSLPDFEVSVSLFELYDRKVLDLLADRAAVPCWEDATGKVQFPGLSWHRADDVEGLQILVEQGNLLRSTGTTSKNIDSSRSHAVLQLQIDQVPGPNRKRKKHRYATMTFIDLAGSERGADTALFSNSTRMEGAEINTSLLALKEVLRAMSSDSSHIPFRGSKLTQALKESLIESTSTCVMIACVSPNLSHCEPTLNTLRYAQCLKDFDKSKDPIRGGASALLQPQQPPQPTSDSRLSVLETSGRRSTATARPLLPPESRTHISVDVPAWEDSIVHSASVPSEPHDSFTPKQASRRPSSANHSKSNSFQSEVSNDASAMLDDILSSPQPDPLQDRRWQEARKLLATHQNALTAMLAMVNDEMTIVSDHAGNSVEDTLRLMEDTRAIQYKQLSHIATVEEQLLQFYGTSGDEPYDEGSYHNNESFEDLRD